MERLCAAGVRGVKVHPPYQGVDFDDTRFVRILKKASELGMLVATHAGLDVGLPAAEQSTPEKLLRARKGPIKIITGHTGWTDDLDAAFSHRTELCRPFTKKYADPEAPYDGYEEADDTEEKARTVRLEKKVFRA